MVNGGINIEIRYVIKTSNLTMLKYSSKQEKNQSLDSIISVHVTSIALLEEEILPPSLSLRFLWVGEFFL